MYNANTNQKKSGVATLIPNKADFRARIFIRDKQGHYVTVKGSILHTYVPNNRASKYLRRKLIRLQGTINKFIIIVTNFDTPLSVTDRSSRLKISKDIIELNSTFNQLNFIDIYRTLDRTTAEYLSSSSLGNFTKIYHPLGHKRSLTNFKR